MNPYTAILPHHSYPLNKRGKKDRIIELENERKYEEDPNLLEIKDRLITDLH